MSDYEGGRDLDSLANLCVALSLLVDVSLIFVIMVSFSSITKQSGIKSNIKPPPPPATLILDTHTFDEVVLVSRLIYSYVSLDSIWIF